MAEERPHTDTTVPHVPASERDIMAALLRTPPKERGEIAERLITETKARVKASRKLVKGSRRLKRKGR